MNVIAAVSENFGIGKNGDLLFSLPPDMKRFRAITLNKIVVMGRRTLESFPGARPLKNRVNIVLSSNKGEAAGALYVKNMKELFAELSKYNSDDIFVIGGGRVYEELLPYCKTAYLTKVFEKKDADTFFPNLDENPAWHILKKSAEEEHEGIKFQYVDYENTDIKSFE